MHTYIGEVVGETQASRTRTRWLETQAQLIKRGDTSLVSRRGGSRLPGTGPALQPPPARHGRPVIRRLLQASRNGNRWCIGCCAPILLLASCGAKCVVAIAGSRDLTP